MKAIKEHEGLFGSNSAIGEMIRELFWSYPARLMGKRDLLNQTQLDK